MFFSSSLSLSLQVGTLGSLPPPSAPAGWKQQRRGESAGSGGLPGVTWPLEALVHSRRSDRSVELSSPLLFTCTKAFSPPDTALSYLLLLLRDFCSPLRVYTRVLATKNPIFSSRAGPEVLHLITGYLNPTLPKHL